MEEAKIVCVSEWLPIEYETRGKMKEPYVVYDDNKMFIRDMVNFDGTQNMKFIDFGEYINENRFPRFIEVGVEADQIRLWKVVDERSNDHSEFLDKDLHDVCSSVIEAEALAKAGIHTVKELLSSSDETIKAAMGDNNYDLYVDVLGMIDAINSVMER